MYYVTWMAFHILGSLISV